MQPGNRDGEGVQKVDTSGGYRRRGMVIAWRRGGAAAQPRGPVAVQTLRLT